MKRMYITLLIIALTLSAPAKEKKPRVHRMKKTAPAGWVDDWNCYLTTKMKRK